MRPQRPFKYSDKLCEVLALMHWDERLARSFRRAYKEYSAAGSPGVPITAVDYRKKFKQETDRG